MARHRGVDDELSRWATAHAPSLLARAEAEAVTLLRDALVDAATADARAHAPRKKAASPLADEPVEAEPERAPDAAEAVTGEARRAPVAGEAGRAPVAGEAGTDELVWAYCVLRATDEFPADLPGVDPAGDVRPVRSDDLIALVSSVPCDEFGSEPLHRNLNDIGWLERVARAHESVLDAVLQMSTIVPLRLCTLYETADGVGQMLEREHDAFSEALEQLEGRAEWAVKVLIDEERLMHAAQSSGEENGAVQRELEGQSEGGAYMLRRRLERQHRATADALASEVAHEVHTGLQTWAIDAVTRPPQNRELSGHQGTMVLNAAYLGPHERVGKLRELVAELEARYAEFGVRIELTGPWPPYNFVSADTSAAAA